MIQFSRADLHIHTVHSDGAATVPELLTHIVTTTEMRLLAITDHDSIAGAQEAAQLARSFGLEVVVGEEVSTADGHLLALFIDRFLPPGRPAAETIAAIHAQGSLAIAPHPFDRSVPSLGRYGLDRPGWQLDAIEGFNAGVIWSQRRCNPAARQAAHALSLPVMWEHNEDRLSGERGPRTEQSGGAQTNPGAGDGDQQSGPGGSQERIPPPLLAPLSVSGLCLFGAVMLLVRRDPDEADDGALGEFEQPGRRRTRAA